ncbi:MAG: EAL domain-containing protein [Anaerolineae bacterium]
MKALREIRRTLRENLLFQFSLASLLSVMVLAVALATLIGRATASQVLEEAMRSAMEDVNARTLRHLTPEDFLHPMLGERYAAFDQFMTEFIVSRRIARIKIWDREGRVIFSTDPSQVGQTFPMKPTLAKALQGETAGTISVPRDMESTQERLLGTLIEVYTPAIFPGSREVVGAIEVYQYYAPYAETIAAMQRHTSVAIGAGAMLLYGVLFLIVRQGWRTIQVQQGKIYQQAAQNEAARTYLQTLQESSPDCIIAADAKGRITVFNPGAEELLGYRAEEVLGQPVEQVYPSLEAARAVMRAMRADPRGRVRNLETTLRHKDGRQISVLISAAILRDADGQEQGTVGYSKDLTERKRAEEALREGEERYRELYEEAPIAYYSVGTDGRICRANRYTAEMSGYALDDLVGRSVFDLYADTPAGKEKAQEVFQRFRAGEEIRGEELEWRTADGRSVWISITVRPFRDAEGRIVESRAMAVDITDRKRAEEALRESEETARALLNAPLDTALLVDIEGTVLAINEIGAQRLGKSVDELVGSCIYDFMPPDVAVERSAKGDEVIRSGQPVYFEDVRQGRYFDNVLYPVLDSQGKVERIAVFAREITERKRAEEALRESEERYALAARGANDGLWDWDLKTNEVYFSPRWKSMLGCEEDEIENSPDEWFNRLHPEDLEQVKVDISAHLEGVTSHFENEHRMLHKDGTYRWMLSRGLAVRDADGTAYRMAGSQTDITERKRAEEQLLHDAFHDGLTGLPNRALFMDRLGRAVERARRRADYLFAVLFLDLDRFKVVNDSLGHTVGDELLIAIAHRLRVCLRAADTVARLGGDEFAILLEDINDVSDATHVADLIGEAVMLPFNADGHEVFASASIGIVLSETGYDRPEGVLRDADIAMYRAKELGRARHEVFDTAMRAGAVARLEVETDLRWSVERQEFEIHYQPIVSLADGRIAGFEALLRWQHPERGLVSPGEFISVAEETGLIVPIDRWVLREACRQVRAWQTQFRTDPPLSISVNLSSKQFAQPDLVEQVEQILQETGLDARSLRLEITESVIMGNIESAAAMLSQLRALGVQVQMDDFGTGYSSLSYLHQFPIDAIKIDRSFISRMDVDGDNSEIVQTIVALAHDLGMDVIAEGVETGEQLAHLRALACEYGQGYYFAKPLDSEAAVALVTGELAVARVM